MEVKEATNPSKFVLVVNFGDNDFSVLVSEIMKDFCDFYKERYNYYIKTCAHYIKEDDAIQHMREFLTYDFIKDFFTSRFVGHYLQEKMFDPYLKIGRVIDHNNLERALELIDYLFKHSDSFYIGSKRGAHTVPS